jgi:hypothetical protein
MVLRYSWRGEVERRGIDKKARTDVAYDVEDTEDRQIIRFTQKDTKKWRWEAQNVRTL